jgi:hypothetical protein
MTGCLDILCAEQDAYLSPRDRCREMRSEIEGYYTQDGYTSHSGGQWALPHANELMGLNTDPVLVEGGLLNT